KEGISKEEIGREEFLKRAFQWKEQYGGRITTQLRSLGTSCDWSKEAFTMDERCSKAVKHVFVKLYEKGLIYQGNRIINWCPCCGTALSDAEVEYEEQASNLWYFRYPFEDGTGYVTVATTRPETIPGDTAVAVNPNDEKYKDLVGKMLVLPLNGRKIPLIADDYVEEGFGTGAVKITPAHDPNDYLVGQRHNLETIKVIGDDGKMNALSGKYEGMDRFEAREAVVKDLDALGSLVKIEPYTHNVGTCYRCHTAVEPALSKQWFVKMQPLAEPAIKAVKEGDVKFVPERFDKIYFNWMENIKDWCISRQLWWGHRIPVYYCQDCGEMMVSEEDVKVCTKCGSKNIKQDEDVLDTWFSSALWPFSTLGYPEKTKELEYFYPTNVLVTAYDIIFFWVARMIFSAIEHTGEVPFKEVLIHGIVRDEQGRKMSKSLGNGVDPLKVIEEYGADALRMSLATGISPGGDTRYIPKKVESCRNFLNKVWNASRFVMMNKENATVKPLSEVKLTLADKWILNRLNKVVEECGDLLDKYDVGMALSKINDFTWSDFCDWYIELQKPALYKDDDNERSNAVSVLVYVLKAILKLLHPYAPFITEEIFQVLTEQKEGALIVAEWPKKVELDLTGADEFENVMEIIKGIRNIRQEMNVAPSKRIKVYFTVSDTNKQILDKANAYVEKLAGVSEIIFTNEQIEKASSIITKIATIQIPLGELVDISVEVERLNKELETTKKEIARAEKMLSNQGFVQKAPKELIENEKKKLADYKEKAEKIQGKINELSK
ncbi:MAG: valine--tRNA ligase, partial [Clostridia bacterium]|nr:valine--tRNA ligase [Clostridia bacterium]